VATKSTYRKTKFPDEPSNRAEIEVAKAFDDVAARVDVLQSPAVVYSTSAAAIASGVSVAVWSGSTAGSPYLTLPLSTALGKGTGIVLIVSNLTAGALTLKPSGAETISGATTFSIAAGSMSVLASDGAGHWSASVVGANSITNAMLAQMPALTIKGNNTGATANAGDLTATQVTAMLNAFTAALKGLVPASGGGTANFLRADGSWAAPPTPAGAIDIQIFTANGTWTLPTGGKLVFIYALGASGGSGGGRRGAAGTTRGGGGGGGAGKAFQFYGDPQFLSLSGAATITIGAGGTAGAAATVDNTDGGAGGPGGNTVFTSLTTFTAQGGGGGGGGTAAGGGAGGLGGSAASASTGVSPGGAGGAGGIGAGATAGAASIVSAVTNNSLTPIHSPAGGGGGGGITAGNATEAGAVGGASFLDPGGTAAANAAGGAGTSRATVGVNIVGTGGGGGSSGTVKTGGAGGSYGAGPGGGGASLNGTNSGPGVVGTPGCMIIITQCG
jgi:hypothetical protein